MTVLPFPRQLRSVSKPLLPVLRERARGFSALAREQTVHMALMAADPLAALLSLDLDLLTECRRSLRIRRTRLHGFLRANQFWRNTVGALTDPAPILPEMFRMAGEQAKAAKTQRAEYLRRIKVISSAIALKSSPTPAA